MFVYSGFMYFDFTMPLALFAITLVSMFLNEKAESKLKFVFEERKFTWKDAVMFVAAMAVMVSVIVFIPQMALMAIFLFSYSMLLFIFTYLFSNKRWYVAAVPPAMFILMYAFLNATALWSDYLINIYAGVFAILITLYIGSLFTWKTTIIFAVLLTGMDIILVLVTGTMVSAATKTMGLKLPILVTLPTLPAIEWNGRMIHMSLGLGDFFFAGLLTIQNFKKFGKKFAILSVIAMAASFFIFEAFLLTYQLAAFPGTLMIISGWLPLIFLKMLKH